MSLKTILEKHEITQAQAARMMGIAQPHVCRLVKGKRPVKLEHWLRLRDGAIEAGLVGLALDASTQIHAATTIAFGPPSGIDHAGADVYALLRKRGVHHASALAAIRRARA